MAENNKIKELNIDLENNYQQYLEKCLIKESDMGTVQQKEMRQAFMAGCGVMIKIMIDLGELEEYRACGIITNMIDQIRVYFEKITSKT